MHLLLKINPELMNILFDFNEPGKIDLEAFMNKNFHFNTAQAICLSDGEKPCYFQKGFSKSISGFSKPLVTAEKITGSLLFD